MKNGQLKINTSVTPALPQTGAVIHPAQFPRLCLTMKETAQVLGLDYFTVQRIHKRGLLRSSGGLRTKLFTLKEIERFLAETTVD